MLLQKRFQNYKSQIIFPVNETDIVYLFFLNVTDFKISWLENYKFFVLI